MKKLSLFLLMSGILLTGKSFAQKHCYSDEVRQELLRTHPEIAISEAEFNRQIEAGLKGINYHKLAGKATTAGDSQVYYAANNPNFWYNIPIVIHIVHDYGSEYMTDDVVFNAFKNWNIVYAKQNPDTATVIAPFKPYIGHPHIRLHLATIDPYGNPTKGITRHRSYLTSNGGEEAKYDDWDPTSYLNIWFINKMSAANGMAAAYAHLPGDAASIPFYDGVIALYDYIDNDKTINHEVGHCFNLIHPWGGNNSAAGGTCADGGSDNVDDTPPTIGHNVTGCTAAALYDTLCANNYFKIYTNVSGNDSLVNYPDTTNSENIMDYTYCSKMFTKGQVERMHEALRSTVAGRSNLWDTTNLRFTGALAPFPDLKPTAEFSCTYAGSRMQYFTCPGTNLRFFNKSWNDTVTKVRWVFSNAPTVHTDSTMNNPTFSSFLDNSFNQPGWVDLSMTATGNHSGDSTIDYPHAVFVADATATPAASYMGEFDPAVDLGKWPTFNYYNNEFKWQPANVGFYDNHCMQYTGYDGRVNPSFGQYPNTGTPVGDIDDMFSQPVDLTALGSGNCNLNFFYSGASRTGNSVDMTDTLIISYSVDKAKTWSTLVTYGRGALANKGALAIPYAPLYRGDWDTKSISIPSSARTNYVVFRFRYKPGVDHMYGISTGNNLYIDRVNFSPWPASIANYKTDDLDIIVLPNPTNSNAFVIVKDVNNTSAKIIVSDIAGKVIYTTTEQINNNEARIEIPESAISVKGIYMVQTITGTQSKTQKLVVY